jgi:membrane-associated phospholipid phosphatase
MLLITDLGLVLLAVLWAAALRRRRLPTALIGAAAVLLSYGLSEWIKILVRAERPCHTHPERPITAGTCPPPDDWSFPSNHSTIAAALTVAVLLLSWRLGLLAVPIGVLVAVSRVALGVHHPADVVAGCLLGATVTAAAVLTVRRHRRFTPTRLERYR